MPILDKSYSNFLLNVGNGTIPTFDGSKIMLLHSLLISFIDDTISLQNLINVIFPYLNYFGTNSLEMLNRAMLTTKMIL